MGFFLLAGLFAAAAGVSFMMDDDDDDAAVPDGTNSPSARNAGGGSVDDGADDDDNDTPSGPRGTAGGDELILTGDDSVHALGGDDTLSARGSGTAYGDVGRDTLTISDRSIGYGGFGKDLLKGADNSVLFGGENNDEFIQTDQSFAYGGAGSDFFSTEGSSTAYGGDDNDGFAAADSSVVYGDSGDDWLRTFDSSTAYGGNGDDWLTAVEDSTAYGGAGDDTLRGTVNTTLYGNNGDDQLTFLPGLVLGMPNDPSETGAGKLFGGSGNDRLNMGLTLSSQDEPIEFFGGIGDDIVIIRKGVHGFGDAGNDTLLADIGGEITGGVGNDLFYVQTLENSFAPDPSNTTTITDFTKSQDRIQVDMQGTPSALDLTDDGIDTTLSIVWEEPYVGPFDTVPNISTIIVKGVTGLKLDDFTFSRGTVSAFLADAPPPPTEGLYDSITTGTGAADTITLAGDQPLAMMGAGNDSVTGGDSARAGRVGLGDGDDIYLDSDGRSVVFGGAGNDSFISDGTFAPSAQDNFFEDEFFGGDGDDSAMLRDDPSAPATELRSVRVLMNMGAGNDVVTADLNYAQGLEIGDGSGDDTIRAWMGSTVISGEGNDSITFGIAEDHVIAGRAPAEVRDLSESDQLILDIDKDLTGALTTRYFPVDPLDDINDDPYTEILVGDDRVAIIWNQNLALDDPRLTINRGVAFA
ncbi:calcium-binding protein [Fuscovulum ytuae]|uniref:Calcium-binding protein n=1 Tax=Fuscovulum ytuae TaxID=3042299 RepID=A0ABY8Q2V8_9RHOB|nr:hypothetical protein [Fuscovulum sp. YMD61]WGV14622.1 hypothetical protein QF092_09925 [Fuscovulum sp. YMD61]